MRQRRRPHQLVGNDAGDALPGRGLRYDHEGEGVAAIAVGHTRRGPGRGVVGAGRDRGRGRRRRHVRVAAVLGRGCREPVGRGHRHHRVEQRRSAGHRGVVARSGDARGDLGLAAAGGGRRGNVVADRAGRGRPRDADGVGDRAVRGRDRGRDSGSHRRDGNGRGAGDARATLVGSRIGERGAARETAVTRRRPHQLVGNNAGRALPRRRLAHHRKGVGLALPGRRIRVGHRGGGPGRGRIGTGRERGRGRGRGLVGVAHIFGADSADHAAAVHGRHREVAGGDIGGRGVEAQPDDAGADLGLGAAGGRRHVDLVGRRSRHRGPRHRDLAGHRAVRGRNTGRRGRRELHPSVARRGLRRTRTKGVGVEVGLHRVGVGGGRHGGRVVIAERAGRGTGATLHRRAVTQHPVHRRTGMGGEGHLHHVVAIVGGIDPRRAQIPGLGRGRDGAGRTGRVHRTHLVVIAVAQRRRRVGVRRSRLTGHKGSAPPGIAGGQRTGSAIDAVRRHRAATNPRRPRHADAHANAGRAQRRRRRRRRHHVAGVRRREVEQVAAAVHRLHEILVGRPRHRGAVVVRSAAPTAAQAHPGTALPLRLPLDHIDQRSTPGARGPRAPRRRRPTHGHLVGVGAVGGTDRRHGPRKRLAPLCTGRQRRTPGRVARLDLVEVRHTPRRRPQHRRGQHVVLHQPVAAVGPHHRPDLVVGGGSRCVPRHRDAVGVAGGRAEVRGHRRWAHHRHRRGAGNTGTSGIGDRVGERGLTGKVVRPRRRPHQLVGDDTGRALSRCRL